MFLANPLSYEAGTAKIYHWSFEREICFGKLYFLEFEKTIWIYRS